jgi:hypothetical protein
MASVISRWIPVIRIFSADFGDEGLEIRLDSGFEDLI